MNRWPDTRETLLARLKDPEDQVAWNDFVALYEPLILRVAQRRGLQDADAREIVQRVLWSVARAADRWEPGQAQGRFRGWLAKVTTNATLNLLSREQKHRGAGSTSVLSMLNEVPQASPELSRLWQAEHRMQLFRMAAAKVELSVEAKTWQCFHRTAVLRQPAKEVADSLAMSLGAVYAARCRVMANIRKTAIRLSVADSGASAGQSPSDSERFGHANGPEGGQQL